VLITFFVTGTRSETQTKKRASPCVCNIGRIALAGLFCSHRWLRSQWFATHNVRNEKLQPFSRRPLKAVLLRTHKKRAEKSDTQNTRYRRAKKEAEVF
jgi:hypothetical protein